MIWQFFAGGVSAPFPVLQRQISGSVPCLAPKKNTQEFWVCHHQDQSLFLKVNLWKDTCPQWHSMWSGPVACGPILKLPSLRASGGAGISYTCQELKPNTLWHLERKYCDRFYFWNTLKRGSQATGCRSKRAGLKSRLALRKSSCSTFPELPFLSLAVFSVFILPTSAPG